jgi:hypothetical protein
MSRWLTIAKNIALDILATGWTIFGLWIAYAVLPEGPTRDLVGGILGMMIIYWLLTMPLRVLPSKEE